MSGHLIVVEGADGVGKNTQCQLLHRYFTKRAKENTTTHTPLPSLYSFPQYNTPTGKAIQAVLNGKPATLEEKISLYADDRKAARNTLLSDLAEGKVVICDRYITSMLIYASALSIPSNAIIAGVPPLSGVQRRDLCFRIAKLELKINQMPVADLQLFLSLDPESNATLRNARGGLDSNEQNTALQWDVYRLYRQLNDINTFGVARKHREIDCNDHPSSVLDIETIHTRIVETLRTELHIG